MTCGGENAVLGAAASVVAAGGGLAGATRMRTGLLPGGADSEATVMPIRSTRPPVVSHAQPDGLHRVRANAGRTASAARGWEICGMTGP